jgi:hypothetical protein
MIVEFNKTEWNKIYVWKSNIWKAPAFTDTNKKYSKFKMWRKETIDGNNYLLPGCPDDFQGLVYVTKRIINYNVIVLWRQQVI